MNYYFNKLTLFLLLSFFSQIIIAQRNCYTHDYHSQLLENNTSYFEKRKEIENHNMSYIFNEKDARTSVTIPVIVHVVWRTDYPAENISDAQILSQLDVINKDFRRLNSDAANTPSIFQSFAADCNINFCLAQRTPQGTSTSGINRVQANRTTNWGTNDEMKKPSAGGVTPWDPTKYLNIYVCTIGSGILGYSCYPGAPAANEGIVIDPKYFGTTGTVVFPYHLGRTATHEIGHWLNLNHIWGDASCGDDLVNDTPIHQGANGGCPAFPKYNTCSSASEMPMNYMDYTDDACMNTFTQGQNARIQALFAPGGYRNSLLSSDGCLPISSSTCVAPSNITANSITTNGSVINWLAVSGALNYTVEYKLSTDTNWTTVNATSNSITLSGLVANSNYSLRVKTNCSASNSVSSSTITFTTLNPVCPSPTTFKVDFITTNSASVYWTAASTNTSFKINYRKQGTTSWTTLTSTTPSLLLQNLAAATTYEIQIFSVCSANTQSIALVGSFTTTSATVACGVPTSLSVNTITESSAKVQWTSVSGVSQYRVYYKKSTESIWKSVDASTTNTTLLLLQAASTYQVKVASICNGSANISTTQTVNFTTLNLTCNSIPSAIKVSQITATNAIVSWSLASNVSSYKLLYKKQSETNWTTISNITSPTYTLLNLSASTIYNIKIASICTNSITSSFSNVLNFTTIASGCFDNYENNNSSSSAKVIATNIVINGNIGTKGDQDWFKFTTTTAQPYFSISIANITSDCQLRLYNTNGMLLAIASINSNTSKIINYNAGKVGSYYIQIYALNNYFDSSKCYDLKVTTSDKIISSKTSNAAVAKEVMEEVIPMDATFSPNPAREYSDIKIKNIDNKLVHFDIFDMTGNFIKSDDMQVFSEQNNYRLETSDFANGIYIIRFRCEDKIIAKRLVIQK